MFVSALQAQFSLCIPKYYLTEIIVMCLVTLVVTSVLNFLMSCEPDTVVAIASRGVGHSDLLQKNSIGGLTLHEIR